TNSGYRLQNNRSGFVDLGIKRDLDEIAKGLWAKAIVSYNTDLIQNINRSKNFEVFQLQIDQNTNDTTYRQFGAKTEQVNNANVQLRGSQFYSEFSIGYQKEWNLHSIQALLLGNYDSYQTNNDLDLFYTGASSRISYSYDNRFLFEGTGAYQYNNRYA